MHNLALLLLSVAELRVEPGYLKPLLCDYLERSRGFWKWPSWKRAYPNIREVLGLVLSTAQTKCGGVPL